MLVYHLEKIFELLEKRKDVAAEDIARREYAYLPLLKNRNKSLMLHRIMAESPQFYISVISDIFKTASGETEEQTKKKRTRASAGYRLLSSFKTVPGEKDGAVDATILLEWIQGVRERAEEADRTRVVDQYIGHILAHAPPDKNDSAWPHQAIRTILERLDSDDIEKGLLIERFNMRGVYGKALYEGGVQERTIAEQYRSWAKAAVDWPRTSAMLERIAQNYDRDAKEEDIRAKQDQMRY